MGLVSKITSSPFLTRYSALHQTLFCDLLILSYFLCEKHIHTINVNVVRGRSYENFSTQKVIIRKFPNMKISRSTVHDKLTHCSYMYGVLMCQG